MIGIATAVDVAALKDTTLLNMGVFALFVAVTMVTATKMPKIPMLSSVVSLRAATSTAVAMPIICLLRSLGCRAYQIRAPRFRPGFPSRWGPAACWSSGHTSR